MRRTLCCSLGMSLQILQCDVRALRSLPIDDVPRTPSLLKAAYPCFRRLRRFWRYEVVGHERVIHFGVIRLCLRGLESEYFPDTSRATCELTEA